MVNVKAGGPPVAGPPAVPCQPRSPGAKVRPDGGVGSEGVTEP